MNIKDKVIKELSKYYGTQVFLETDPSYIFDGEGYDGYTFYYGKKKKDMNGLEYTHKRIIVIGSSDNVCFNDCLPAKIIKMLVRFYEAGIEHDK